MGRRGSSRLACLALLASLCVTGCSGEDFYSFTVKDHQGQDVALEAYRGKVSHWQGRLLPQPPAGIGAAAPRHQHVPSLAAVITRTTHSCDTSGR